MRADPPTTLPAGLTSLSASSVALFRRDPEKWRRRYIDVEHEPVSSSAVLGGAVGRAEGTSYQQQISDGSRLRVTDVLDLFSDEWAIQLEHREVAWEEDERPGPVKDSGARILALYHRIVAPTVRPVSVERKFELQLPGVDWTFTGFFDVEEEDGAIDDMKVRGHSRGVVSAAEAADELQPTAYLFARRAEAAHPDAPDWLTATPQFRYHSLVRPLPTGDPSPKHVLVTPTTRTEEQLDSFLALLYSVAAEMAWRVEYDVWVGARPGDPLCSPRYCGYWSRCPFGGAHRPAVAPAPALARKPTQDEVWDAVKATLRRSGPMAGTTTAARVGSHLGVSTRAAAGHLRGLSAAKVVRSERPAKHYKTKPPVPVPGPNVYRLLDDGQSGRQLVESLKQSGAGKELANA